MKFDDTVLTKDLGPRILKALGKLTPLPTSGIVAGQSVASAIDEVLGLARPVYNDVDCFLPPAASDREERDAVAAWNRRSLNGGLTYWAEQGLESNAYRELLEVRRKELYSIEKTNREGLLNTIEVRWSWQSERSQNKALDLISVFDINATQAAIDLETGHLTVSPAFRQYFRTRQLQIETLFTPVHSLLRLFKKSGEIPLAYTDRSQAVRMVHAYLRANQGADWMRELRIEGMRQNSVFVDKDVLRQQGWPPFSSADCPQGEWVRVGQSLAETPMCFGQKYRAMYEAYASELAPWFEVTENRKGSLWLATAKPTQNTKLERRPLQVYFGGCSPYHGAKYFRQWDAPPKPRALAREDRFERWVDLLTEPGQQELLRKAYRVTGPAYLEGLDSDKQMAEVVRIQNEHPEFLLATAGLPFAMQYRALKSLRRQFKSVGVPEAWGVLHQQSSQFVRQMLEDAEVMAAVMQGLAGSQEPMVAPLPLPSQVQTPDGEGVEVVQLLSQYDLNTEGAKMAHCVAGYGHAVQQFRCRIISFRRGAKAAERATAEWVIEENTAAAPVQELTRKDGLTLKVYPLKVRCAQLHSVCNQPADLRLEIAEAQVRAEFNLQLEQMGVAGWDLLKPGVLTEMMNRTNQTRKNFRQVWEHQDAEEVPF